MQQNTYLFILILCLFTLGQISCNDTDTTEKQEAKVDSFVVIDSLALNSKKRNKKDSVIPILPEKVEKQKEEILKEPDKIVDAETKLVAKELVIEADYDVNSLNAALNQLKPSLTRNAQRVVMNAIQIDFSDIEREGVVKGTFIGETNRSYSIRSYMNRLTMVGPFNIIVTNLERDKSGKIINVILKEIQNFNS